jgi:hypothetical protein
MTNASGTYENSRYIMVTTRTLAPGAYASVSIQFTNPSNDYINHTPVTHSRGLPSSADDTS